MYVKSTRPSAKREVQEERSAQRDDRVSRSAKRAMRMCPRSGQILSIMFGLILLELCILWWKNFLL